MSFAASEPSLLERMPSRRRPQPIHLQQGRGTCVGRDTCMRGCPHGAYFSANASTLPWAARTGKLTIRPHSVVHSILVDERTGRATGVRVIDAKTHDVTEYRSRIVFVNASALNSNLILLNSTSTRHPNGLGNGSDVIGRYQGRVLNIHPALLPAFGGVGMYGVRVHRAVLESGARVSGAVFIIQSVRGLPMVNR